MGILNKLLGSSSSSNQEKEEKEDEEKYLSELKKKERTEVATRNKEIIQQGKQYAMKEAWKGAVAVGSAAVKGVEYTGSTEIGKYAKARAKGTVEYIPESFSKLTADYEAGRISKKIYDDAYRQHKIDLAKERGRKGEELAHRKSQGEDSASIKKRKIESDVKLAYLTTKAKSLARLEARKEWYQRRQESLQDPQAWNNRVIASKRFVGVRRIQNIDSLGIFALPSQTQSFQTPNIQQQSQQIVRPQPKYSVNHLNSLLGYNPNTQGQQQITQSQSPDMSLMHSLLGFHKSESRIQPKSNKKNQEQSTQNKQKRLRQNIFSGIWEWV